MKYKMVHTDFEGKLMTTLFLRLEGKQGRPVGQFLKISGSNATAPQGKNSFGNSCEPMLTSM